MITFERVGVETVPARSPLEPIRQVHHTVPPWPVPKAAEPSLLWRLLLVSIGFGVDMVGWVLVLTVLLSFIGLPLFIFGVALTQAQQR